MKLIIQIPCLNEEEQLPTTLADLPRELPGVERIEWLIIDDGSTDRTAEVARECGVDHVVRHETNRGLAEAFSTGLDACLQRGADIIVNTDADNQYRAADIGELIAPILRREADMVVGDRRTETVVEFSWLKKRLQKLGSWVVRQASGTNIPDATSGFRALSRSCALKLHVISEYSYTIETLIQAGRRNVAVTHVPIRTNPKTRNSRLFSSTVEYVRRSGATIIRMYAMYRPLTIFFGLGSLFFAAGAVIFARFIYYFVQDGGAGHVQSLLLGTVLIIAGFQATLTGFIADLIANNRRLSEQALWRIRKLELGIATHESPDGRSTIAAAPAGDGASEPRHSLSGT